MYHENRRVWWIWLIYFSIAMCASFAVWMVISFPEVKRSTVGAIMGLGAIVFGFTFMVILAIAFHRYRVELEPQTLTFGYSRWHVTVAKDDIASIREEPVRFWAFLGLGWRVDRHKRIGYVAAFGPGIEVTLKTGRVYVFSCLEPERFLAEYGTLPVTQSA